VQNSLNISYKQVPHRFAVFARLQPPTHPCWQGHEVFSHQRKHRIYDVHQRPKFDHLLLDICQIDVLKVSLEVRQSRPLAHEIQGNRLPGFTEVKALLPRQTLPKQQPMLGLFPFMKNFDTSGSFSNEDKIPLPALGLQNQAVGKPLIQSLLTDPSRCCCLNLAGHHFFQRRKGETPSRISPSLLTALELRRLAAWHHRRLTQGKNARPECRLGSMRAP